MSDKEEFTEQQKLFLDILFNECDGNIKLAAELAGYARLSNVLRSQKVRDKIRELAEGVVTIHSAQAAFTLVQGLEADGTDPGYLTKFNVARDILDRVGLGKKDRVDVNVSAPTGIFLLPAKKETNENSSAGDNV